MGAFLQYLAGHSLDEDHDGFLLTDAGTPPSLLERPDHARLRLETSRVGIFYFGDICSGSIKRVATAVGEGSLVVRLAFHRLRAAPEI